MKATVILPLLAAAVCAVRFIVFSPSIVGYQLITDALLNSTEVLLRTSSQPIKNNLSREFYNASQTCKRGTRRGNIPDPALRVIDPTARLISAHHTDLLIGDIAGRVDRLGYVESLAALVSGSKRAHILLEAQQSVRSRLAGTNGGSESDLYVFKLAACGYAARYL